MPKYWNRTPAAAPPKSWGIYDKGDPGLARWRDRIMDFSHGIQKRRNGREIHDGWKRENSRSKYEDLFVSVLESYHP